MPQRSQEEREGNPKDQQTNDCIDQGRMVCALNGKATEQRPERGCRPGQDSDDGDDATKELIGDSELRQTVGSDGEEHICSATQRP